MPKHPSTSKPAKKHAQYPPSLWVSKLPATIFPRGPRALYLYMAAFPSGICYLFNYRLAAKFAVTIRTIRRWKTWLRKHRLIHTWWPDSLRPRITIHHYSSFHAWITTMAIPTPQKNAPKLRLTQAEKDARRRKLLKQILSTSRRTKLSP